MLLATSRQPLSYPATSPVLTGSSLEAASSPRLWTVEASCQAYCATATAITTSVVPLTLISSQLTFQHPHGQPSTASQLRSQQTHQPCYTVPDSAAQLINRPRPTRRSWPLHHHHQHHHVACLLLTDPHMVAQTGEVNTSLQCLNGQA